MLIRLILQMDVGKYQEDLYVCQSIENQVETH